VLPTLREFVGSGVFPATSTRYASTDNGACKARLNLSVEDGGMSIGFVRSVIRSTNLVLVRPRSRIWWEVVAEGAGKPSCFADRRLAISYAKMWAAANAPSTVRVLGSSDLIEREWNYS
jgi:hypothetical protein